MEHTVGGGGVRHGVVRMLTSLSARELEESWFDFGQGQEPSSAKPPSRSWGPPGL
jgi:hypothetical protein